MFQKYQFWGSNSGILKVYYYLLTLILCILQQCRSWIHIIQKVKQVILSLKIWMINLLLDSTDKSLESKLQKI